MSSIILTNWTVYFADDVGVGAGKGMKQIKWTGGATGTNTVNELYSAVMNLFDNAAQNDAIDSIPLRAVTPTLYEIGSFDAGDKQPWFIDPESVKHLTGAGLNTAKWARTGGGTGDAGIIKITRTGTNIVAATDVGNTIANGTATGWLLHASGANLWIRPTSNAALHDWTASSGNIVCNGHTDVQAAGTTSAECIYANVFTLGTIESATEMYVYQNSVALTQWWSTGHIDILVLVKDFGVVTDRGILTVYARQYSKLYDNFSVTVPTGGRTPIPVATSADTNNPTGYWTFTATAASGTGTFNVGNYLYVGATWATATAKAVITAVAGTSGAASTPILTYYLIGNLTAIVNTNAVKEYVPTTGIDGDASCTVVTPTATVGGPSALAVPPTITFAAGADKDLNNGAGARPYDVSIDCNQNTLADVYQYLKYVTRRGSVADIDAGGQTVIGQEYVAVGDIRLPYDGQTTNFVEGETVNGQTSGATGVVTADHDAGVTGAIILRTVRGTFVDNENIRSGVTVRAVANIPTGAEAITPFKAAPFGTFAGGKFFGARGVWIFDTLTADATNYQLIDSLGVQQIPPAVVSVTITVQDAGALPIVGAQVAIFKNDDSTVLASTPTNVSGISSALVAASLGGIYLRVRQSTNTTNFLTSIAGITNAANDVITTLVTHSFVNGEAVMYKKNGGTAAVGLTDNTVYYVNNLGGNTTLSLYDTAAHGFAGGATGRMDLFVNLAETHSLDPVRYYPNSTVGTIGTSNFSATITMIEDTTVTG